MHDGRQGRGLPPPLPARPRVCRLLSGAPSARPLPSGLLCHQNHTTSVTRLQILPSDPRALLLWLFSLFYTRPSGLRRVPVMFASPHRHLLFKLWTRTSFAPSLPGKCFYETQ